MDIGDWSRLDSEGNDVISRLPISILSKKEKKNTKGRRIFDNFKKKVRIPKRTQTNATGNSETETIKKEPRTEEPFPLSPGIPEGSGLVNYA